MGNFQSDATRAATLPARKMLSEGIDIQAIGEATNAVVKGALQACIDHIDELESDFKALRAAVAYRDRASLTPAPTQGDGDRGQIGTAWNEADPVLHPAPSPAPVSAPATDGEVVEPAGRLCYVAHGRAWFTTAPLADQWGDDWNDAPYEHNAGSPYRIEGHTLVAVPFDAGDMETPDAHAYNSRWSVEDINALKTPWLKCTAAVVWAGSSFADFQTALLKAGGTALMPWRALSNHAPGHGEAVPVALENDRRLQAALDYLAENKSRSLAFDGKTFCEDDNSDLWIVTEVQGGLNDREWVLLGSGRTPAEALLDAHPATGEKPAPATGKE